MNKFFLDSSVIIESMKKQGLKEAKVIYSFIENNILYMQIFNNIIVVDEVVYFFIKNKYKIPYFTLYDVKDILEMFEYLEIKKEISELMYEFIEKYNLRTHDAIILATCKYYNIDNLISVDSDFKNPCKNENINLINSLNKLESELLIK